MLPKELHVRMEDDGEGGKFPLAEECAAELARPGTVNVGKYVLVETYSLTTETVKHGVKTEYIRCEGTR